MSFDTQYLSLKPLADDTKKRQKLMRKLVKRGYGWKSISTIFNNHNILPKTNPYWTPKLVFGVYQKVRKRDNILKNHKWTNIKVENKE